MSDLDKLMNNLKKNKEEAEVKETPQETEGLNDDTDEDQEDQEDFDDEDDQEDEVEEMKPLPKKIEKVADPKEDQEDNNPIDHEVALLQNEGIFRRELLLTLKELVDVQKVNAQMMIDIKKAVTGGKDAK